MTTIAHWFSGIAQARQVLLDLLTSGVPRSDIGVLFAPAGGDQPTPAGGPDASVTDDDHLAYASIAGSDNASTHRLPTGGVVMAVGPLADALGQASGETDKAVYSAALRTLGVSVEEANALAQQFSAGGALVAVSADPMWETIVRGVFHHAMDPTLNGPHETQGPDPQHEEGEARHEPPTASVGGLTSGAIPGGWGTAGLDLEGLGDDRLKKD